MTGSLSKYSYKWQVNKISEEKGIEFGIKFDDPNTIGIFTVNFYLINILKLGE